MRCALLLLLLVAACGGGGEDTIDWDEGVDDFVDAACYDFDACNNEEPDDCEADVRFDLNDARSELVDTGFQECLACLAAKAEAFRAAAATCQIAADDEAAIYAACDLNPLFDYDGDGTVDNDDDEACAGYP